MITARRFAGRHYAVFGLARTGLSVVASLRASGGTVTVWDDDEARRSAMTDVQVEVRDLGSAELGGFDGIVVSPGVPLNTHPLARRAREAGVPLIGDTELFAQARAELPPHKVVGITGTNGKSTTTALIHHLLVAAGLPATLGGNIGLPILAQEPLPAGGIYVLELSSFQLDLTHSLACEVAVLLNITPDHLDRHGDMAGYAAAKARLFEMQAAGGVAIVASEDEWSARIARKRKVCPIAPVDAEAQAAWPTLAGPHNAQNAAAAIAAALALGLSKEQIESGMRSFAGLAHRMERVAVIGEVLFVNDSKATNPTSTAPALAAFSGIHWIVGGRRKTDELDACLPYLANVRAAYIVGEAEAVFAQLLGAQIPVVRAGTVQQATRLAAGAAKSGEVVLLSPACASYDQFSDFEARGDAFRGVVQELAA